MFRASEREITSKLMKDAIFFDVIDPILSPCDSRVLNKCFQYLEINKALGRYDDPRLYNPLEYPHSTRYRESCFPEIEHNPQADYFQAELARIEVPYGHTGFLTSLEQIVRDKAGNFYPSNVLFWGSPDFDEIEISSLRWYLTLTPFEGLSPARFINTNTVPLTSNLLPGRPHPDLYEIDRLFYPAHAATTRINLKIPGGNILRFFVSCLPQTSYQWIFSGRLRAQIQSNFSLSASSNANTLCF